jgi:hypothetical protein
VSKLDELMAKLPPGAYLRVNQAGLERLEVDFLAEARGYLLEALEARAAALADPLRREAERLIAALYAGMAEHLPGASLEVDRTTLPYHVGLTFRAPTWSASINVDTLYSSLMPGMAPHVLRRVRAHVKAKGLAYQDPPPPDRVERHVAWLLTTCRAPMPRRPGVACTRDRGHEGDHWQLTEWRQYHQWPRET